MNYRIERPRPQRMPTPAYTAAHCRGEGAFPLHAMVQCDAFFDTPSDWLEARNRRDYREVAVALPPECVPRLRQLLKADGWEVAQ